MPIEDVNETAVTGWSGDSDFFAFPEYQVFDASVALSVLQGNLAGVIFRNCIDITVCDAIIEKFWAHPERQRRSAEAPGFYIGALHWLTPMSELMSKVTRAREALYSILDTPNEPTAEAISKILAASGGTLKSARAAIHNGQPVCDRLIRAWEGEGSYSLNPHEDESQISWPGQAEFEISQLTSHPVCALNICLENTSGGDLHYWNIRPDQQSKQRLGVQHSGIPYPLESLTQYQRFVVPIRRGDLYLFNGALLHAVTSKSGPADRRTTLSNLMSINDNHELIQWT
ncbi:hypothetical protein ALQ93_200142 [Pseudomonas syringae pv. pisi]|uniref:hypothetical protein n=1 Tax=Pseudomonas syringae group TaxID=136849 RepID=UPI000EFDEEFD|nr:MULTISPECIES: hypothetical protein [Pseudomonas syringae group]RML55862.1 hypothetical protein ALQ93_200142 [Pseudomonas syringae pv. pisi]RMV62569.1 hypothetical protein ALP08_00443 [Pseudomonas syringae pv. pisi]UPT38518.1 hypothetical protein LT107_07835 [Pseudomonas amygdali pv. loropetali]